MGSVFPFDMALHLLGLVSGSAAINLKLEHHWQSSYSVTTFVPALPSHGLPSFFTSSVEVTLQHNLD